MSDGLIRTLRRPEPYLHSPVDDLESFYYTAQWAAAFNDGANGRKHDGAKIQEFREMIAGDERPLATGMVQKSLDPLTAGSKYGPFFASSLSLLVPWLDRFVTLRRDWNRVENRAAEFNSKDKETHLGLNFLIYGYRGVAEYLELVHEHRASLQGATV